MTHHARPLALLLALSLAAPAGPARAECPSHPADLAPGVLGDEVPTPTWTVYGDGALNVQDVLTLLQAAVSSRILAWEEPFSMDCPSPPGDIAPGTEVSGVFTPDMTDGALNVSDVIVALRLAVGLITLDPDYVRPVVGDARSGDRVIAGEVLDGVNGGGLPGVTVSAFSADAPVGSVLTDAAGAFLLQGLPTGEILLELDGSTSTAPTGKFSTLELVVESDSEGTTVLRSITLPDEEDPDGVTDKFTADETGTVDTEIDLSNTDGDVGIATGPGSKIENDDGPVDGEVDLAATPVDGDELPGELTDEDTGDDLSGTGAVAVSPADGKFTAGSGFAARRKGLVPAGFDLTLPNRRGLPVDTAVDIWRWEGSAGRWVNHTFATGFGGVVVDLGGPTAVFAAGAATQGGIYAAALPIDFGCTTILTGRVIDQHDVPLPGVFVDSDLGVFDVTGPDGTFYFEAFPAYSGVDIGDCAAMGFDLRLRGGLDLGGASDVVSVSELDVFLGGYTDLLDLVLSVPDEACLSGLVLKNGVPESGPVSLDGPDPGTLTANAEGRFFASGLTPGEYTASFQFSGEMSERDFDFELFPRQCSTVRLEVNEGAGSRRIEVRVSLDHDDDLLTPGLPATGALVELRGTDAVSMNGLQAVTGPTGRAVFEGVNGPFHVLTLIEGPIPGADPPPGEPTPWYRVGASLTSNAPTGRIGLPLMPPPAVDVDGLEDPPGLIMGTISNLPTPAFEEFQAIAVLPRGHFAGTDPWGGVDGSDYSAPAFARPFDLAFGLYDGQPPFQALELGFFGPFQCPEPIDPYDVPIVIENLDYSTIDPLFFDTLVDVTYSGFVTGVKEQLMDLLGKGADGRGFYTYLDYTGPGEAPPATARIPDPLSAGALPWELWLEVGSEPYGPGESSQFCIVPLPEPLGSSVHVGFLPPPSFSPWSFGANTTLADVLSTPIQFDSSGLSPPNGYDALGYYTNSYEPPPGEPQQTWFVVYLAPASLQQAVLPPTPVPLLFPDRELAVLIQSVRSSALPTDFEILFDDQVDDRLAGALDTATPACASDDSDSTYIDPDVP